MKCQFLKRFLTLKNVSCKSNRKSIVPVRRPGNLDGKCVKLRLPKRK